MRRAADSTRSVAGRTVGAALLVAAIAAGCAVVPAVPMVPAQAAPAVQPVSVEVFAYPKSGQSAEQQRRDRYECHLWAVNQTGVEPSTLTVQNNVQAAPDGTLIYPPVTTTATTAATGAVIGAVASHSGHRTEGAIIGTIIGAIVGSIAEASSERALAGRAAVQSGSTDAVRGSVEERADRYRRAMGACLLGRGYQVR